jgi:hypothetical protein
MFKGMDIEQKRQDSKVERLEREKRSWTESRRVWTA